LLEQPASIGQRMLWLIDHHRGDQGALNYPVLARARGPLDAAGLAAALERVVARHETLRTTFGRRRGLLTQLIHEPAPAPIAGRDVSGTPDPDAALRDGLAAEIAERVDPTATPFRATLWRLAPDDHVLCLNVHHLVTDAWSCGLILDDLLHALGGGAALPRVGWQYRHYVRWQRGQLAAERLRPHRDYWRARLADLQFSALPLRDHVNGSPAGRSGTARAVIGPAAVDGLRRLARDHGTTLFTVMLAAYYALLHRVTGQTDVAIASLFANRTRPEVMRTVGFFANLVILRTRFERGATFAGLLRRAHATVGEALVHQHFPYYLLSQEELRAGDRRADEVVFQMLPEIPAPVAIGPVEVEVLLPAVASRFDLELAVVPRGGGLDVLLQYSRRRVDDSWAAGFVAGYASFAADVAAASGLGLAG
jgi:hypothetical protein